MGHGYNLLDFIDTVRSEVNLWTGKEGFGPCMVLMIEGCPTGDIETEVGYEI